MPFGRRGTVHAESIAECIAHQTSIVKTGYIFDPIGMGGTANAFSLNDSQTLVVGLAKVGGYIFGRFCNNPGGVKQAYMILDEEVPAGNHCEDFFMSAWDELWDTDVMLELRVLYAGADRQLPVTLKLTKSPCHECAKKLIKFSEKYKLDLRMKILKLYSGDVGEIINATALLAMMSKGIAVKMWEVHISKSEYTGLTKKGQRHELSSLKEHLKAVEQMRAFLLQADTSEDEAVKSESEIKRQQLERLAIKQGVDQMAMWASDIEGFQSNSIDRVVKTLGQINAKQLHSDDKKRAVQMELLALADQNLLNEAEVEYILHSALYGGGEGKL